MSTLPQPPTAAGSWYKKKRFTLPLALFAAVVLINAVSDAEAEPGTAPTPEVRYVTEFVTETVTMEPVTVTEWVTEYVTEYVTEWATAEPQPEPVPEPQPEPEPVPEPQALVPQQAPEEEPVERSVYFENCTAARDAGAAPVRRGDPGYAPHLDRDNDGIGCE